MLNMKKKEMFRAEDAVAYRIHFTSMIYGYGNVGWDEIKKEDCKRCRHLSQLNDYLAPRSAGTKKAGAQLDTWDYGVCVEAHDELIKQFDISEQDFRPCRNKKGEIVYYQLVPQHTLLPIANVNGWTPLKPCSSCGRQQYRNNNKNSWDNDDIVYISKEALDDLHDLNFTFEMFEMYFHDLIVSKRVYEFFSQYYPRLLFDPVFLKE